LVYENTNWSMKINTKKTRMKTNQSLRTYYRQITRFVIFVTVISGIFIFANGNRPAISLNSSSFNVVSSCIPRIDSVNAACTCSDDIFCNSNADCEIGEHCNTVNICCGDPCGCEGRKTQRACVKDNNDPPPTGIASTPTPTICVAPSAPTNLQLNCASNGTQAIISWGAVSGADRYHLRLNNLNNTNGSTMDCNTAGDLCLDNYNGNTSYTFTVTPSSSYTFWLHSGSSCGGVSDAAGLPNQPFTCGPTNTPIPSSNPTPTTVIQMCRLDVAITLPTPAPSDTQIKLRIKFQGVLLANIANDAWKTQPVSVTVIKQIADPQTNQGAQTIFSKSFDNVQVQAIGEADAKGIAIWEGTVAATGVTAGEKYSILVKGPKHLQRKFCQNNPDDRGEEGFPYRCLGAGSITLTSSENVLDFSKVLLQAGDLPDGTAGGQDGIVNSYDVSLVLNMIRNGQSNMAADVAIADMDLNGVVNAKDRSYLIETLEEKYGDEE
jgi:hypothetical protein